jgi:hypothetical protein
MSQRQVRTSTAPADQYNGGRHLARLLQQDESLPGESRTNLEDSVFLTEVFLEVAGRRERGVVIRDAGSCADAAFSATPLLGWRVRTRDLGDT